MITFNQDPHVPDFSTLDNFSVTSIMFFRKKSVLFYNNILWKQEPADNEDDIVKFCEETGLPVALDETINSVRGNLLRVLQKHSHSGIAAVVSY